MREDKIIKKHIGKILLVLTPAFMYVMFEWIIGNLLEVQGIYLVLNLLFFCLVYWAIFAITNSMRVSYLVLNIIFTVWAIAEYYVVGFRDRPIMIWDVRALGTAMTVAENYQYDITAHLLIAFALVAAWTVLVWIFPVRMSSVKKHIIAAIASVAVFVVSMTAFFQVAIPYYGIEIGMWDPVSSYAEHGYMVSTLRVISYITVDTPDGYSLEEVQKIQEEIQNGKEEQNLRWKTESDIVPTNIICIMNESYSDLQVIAPFETDVSYMDYYDSIEENVIKGDLYMPIFGSMTCNSEFEVLTGNSIAFSPSGAVPYQIYMKEPTYSLPRILKNSGYQTVAMHPNEGGNWNRNEAYKALGFDEFYDIHSFENPEYERNYIADISDYKKIIELTEQKPQDEPMFIFDVTMQNHGGYEDDFEATVHLTEYDNMDETEQYLSLLRRSDEALKYLIEYYSGIEEPTMIVFFGDHQPSVEPEFYEALYRDSLSEIPTEDYLRRYITPFFIWTNYPTESMLSEQLSSQYLSCAILQRANIEMSDYFYFLSQMYETAPIIHIMGYYNSDNQWESWTDWTEKKEYPLFNQFDMLQYNNMFDRNRISSIYE